MSFNLNSVLSRCSSFLFISSLAGCVNLEPGMRLDALRVPSTYAQAPKTPIIKAITPELLEYENALQNRSLADQVKALMGEPSSYLIGPGDLLSILVWDHPELNIAAAGAQALSSSGAQSPAAFVVDQQGIIQFPYVGAIKVSGLTELQARNLLADNLIRSIKRPDITLRVLGYRSKKVYVDGEVKAPGNQPIDDVPMTLLEGITRAGGFLPTSDQSSVFVARDGVKYPINIPMLVKQGVDMSRLMLAPNDLVRVPSRDEGKVFVLGEVTAPRALPMNNGKLTLAEALGEAGGVSQVTSAARQVYVIRDANQQSPLVFNLDGASPAAFALAGGFDLKPHDVVFVDAAGLARFNRVISLILPTAVGASQSYGQMR